MAIGGALQRAHDRDGKNAADGIVGELALQAQQRFGVDARAHGVVDDDPIVFARIGDRREARCAPSAHASRRRSATP